MRIAFCTRCRREAWVNTMTRRDERIGEYCGDCWEAVDHDPPDRNLWGVDSGPNHNDPGFDNVVRAYEEDR